MTGFMDIYTLIFLVLAVVIFFKLRGVLGQRSGSERPPFDPYSRRTEAKPDAAGKPASTSNDNVIALPGTVLDVPPVRSEPSTVAPGTPAAEGLAAIRATDPGFSETAFIDGARTAYEIIVTAFAKGDTATLKPLLGRDVYDGFAAAINERQSRGETVEFSFVGIDKVEIDHASARGSNAQIALRIRAQIVSATRDKAGQIIDGDPVATIDVNDLWTFARDTSSRDPNWMLVATESVE